MMEVYNQKCLSCGSVKVINHLVKDPGEPEKIFVECAECGKFVARYILNPGGYYHHQQGFDSFLKSLSRSGFTMSGKGLIHDFETIHKNAEKNYKRLQYLLKENQEKECP